MVTYFLAETPLDGNEFVANLLDKWKVEAKKNKESKLWWRKIEGAPEPTIKSNAPVEAVLEYPDYQEDTSAPDWMR
jgi:hypothetical protein